VDIKDILIIDDDPAIIKLFELVAKKLGLRIIPAKDGVEGLKKFNQQNFLLVITDLKMPKMDGVEFITKARQAPKFQNFPFIIVSGNLQEFSADVALLKNLTILEKPIKRSEIEDLFKTTLKIFSGEETKAVPFAEVETFLIQKLQKTSQLMLEIITKDKPTVQIMPDPPSDGYIPSNFFISCPLIVGSNRVSINFNFNFPLAEAMKNAIGDKKNNNREEILEALKKIVHSLVKKLFENSPYIDDFGKTRHLSLYGAGENDMLFGVENGEHFSSLQVTNKHGELFVHLFKDL
jgi:CheY-like chemotaxis protein